MATELAKAYVQIIPSAVGIQGRIQKEIEPEADSAGSSFGGKMVGMIKKVIATAAIGKALSASISEGAALEQSLGGIETLFKDSADKVKANAAKAYQTAGMSANDYMELTTSFSASLLSSLAGDTSKAADVADMAMVDMSDNANKMGTNMEDIKNAWDAVKGVLGGFKENVLAFFGIHSPSRWGAYVGEMIDTGIANGLIGKTTLVSNAAAELQKSVKKPIGTSMDLAISGKSSTESQNSTIAEKLEALLEYLKTTSRRGDGSIVINLNDREVARALREMGVVFE